MCINFFLEQKQESVSTRRKTPSERANRFDVARLRRDDQGPVVGYDIS